MILIVESPGLEDITTGDRSAKCLFDILQLLRIDAEYRPIHSVQLLEGILEESKYSTLHLSGHGNTEGMQFTDGTLVPWEQLLRLVAPYTVRKTVVLDSCDSFAYALDTAKLDTTLNNQGLPIPQLPLYLLTHFGKVGFADAALAWSLYYRHLEEFDRPEPRHVRAALEAVQGADLKIKICAAHRNKRGYRNISPWAMKTKKSKGE